jgi:Bacteriophage head to tail connecting protein
MKKLKVADVKKIYGKLKGERGTWENHWQEVADHILPRKNTINTTRTPGEKRTWQLLDNVGVQSNELLSGFLHGTLSNADAMWFEMTTGDLVLDSQDDVRQYLQEVARRIHHTLNNSNFQTEVHELYTDLGAFGTACQLIEEDDSDVVKFSTKFIKDYFIKENRAGFVDFLIHEANWKSDDLIEEFTDKGMHKDVMDDYNKGKNGDFKVVNCVYSCEGKYYSMYILWDKDKLLREDKYNEFPYTVPRWSKASGESYGRSPGMNALPEMKVLNKMNETMLIGAQKKVDPPVQMPDDGFVMPFVTRPGGINYYRSGTNDFARPIFNDTNLDFGYQAMEDRRQRVRDAFYVDQLKLRQAGPMMTATEVLQRTEEAMRLMGPLLGRMQSEYLRPMIDRVYNIMVRKGKIPAAPLALKGVRLDVRYSSLIARSQRLSEAQNIMRTVEAIAPFIQLDNQVADIFNGEAAARIISGIYGFPQLAIRSTADIQKIRAQRAEMIRQQQEMMRKQQDLANANSMADTAKKVSGSSGQE